MLVDLPEIQYSKDHGSRMIRFQRDPEETRKHRAGYISIFNQNRAAKPGEYPTDFTSLMHVNSVRMGWLPPLHLGTKIWQRSGSQTKKKNTKVPCMLVCNQTFRKKIDGRTYEKLGRGLKSMSTIEKGTVVALYVGFPALNNTAGRIAANPADDPHLECIGEHQASSERTENVRWLYGKFAYDPLMSTAHLINCVPTKHNCTTSKKHCIVHCMIC